MRAYSGRAACACKSAQQGIDCLRAGATRSATVIALEGGALLTQVSRELFMHFIASKPRTLQIYLHKVLPRLPHPILLLLHC